MPAPTWASAAFDLPEASASAHESSWPTPGISRSIMNLRGMGFSFAGKTRRDGELQPDGRSDNVDGYFSQTELNRGPDARRHRRLPRERPCLDRHRAARGVPRRGRALADAPGAARRAALPRALGVR